MYAARNKDGRLFLFGMQPVKNETTGEWERNTSDDCRNFMRQIPDTDFYSNVRWEDAEPTRLYTSKETITIQKGSWCDVNTKHTRNKRNVFGIEKKSRFKF